MLAAVATLLNGSSSCTVIVPEVTPAVSVCVVVVYTSLLAAAAMTVSVCVAVGLVSALSVAVSTGLPASVSLYLKLALLRTAGDGHAGDRRVPRRVVPELTRRRCVVRMIVCVLAAVATLLNGSSSCTVMVPEVTPAVSVCVVVVYTSLLAAAALTVMAELVPVMALLFVSVAVMV